MNKTLIESKENIETELLTKRKQFEINGQREQDLDARENALRCDKQIFDHEKAQFERTWQETEHQLERKRKDQEEEFSDKCAIWVQDNDALRQELSKKNYEADVMKRILAKKLD